MITLISVTVSKQNQLKIKKDEAKVKIIVAKPTVHPHRERIKYYKLFYLCY